MARRATLGAVVCAAALSVTSAAGPAPKPSVRVLAFAKTAGFRHESIPVALRALRELGEECGLTVDATEDGAAFSAAGLAGYDVVVFLLTTGDVLDQDEQRAFERWIRAGGGFVGVHSAADTEYDWPWYGALVGAYFQNHPAVQKAAIDVVDRNHPSTARLPRRWARIDEWYNFAAAPRGVRILATLDESSYSPGDGAMGRDHPIAWAHEYDGGRAWYTGAGHTAEAYAEPLFRAHLLGGLLYAAGLGQPRILSVRATVRERRLAVTARYAGCLRCSARLRVRTGERWSSKPMPAEDGVARAVSARLAPGRHAFEVVLEDSATSLRTTVSRVATVR